MAMAFELFMLDALDHFKRVEYIGNVLVVLFSIKVCVDLAQLALAWRKR